MFLMQIKKEKWIKSKNCVIVMMLLFVSTHALVAKPKGSVVEPDYTKGENPEGENSTPWALGSTGAFGNIWHGDQRMIQIQSVGSGSPADGKLKQLDVILGVESPKVDARADVKCSRPDCGVSGDCGHFKSEARKVLSAAITEAEKEGGKLVLNVWRPETVSLEPEGKQQTPRSVLKQPLSAHMIKVTLDLPVKGSFSATSPWNCKKTEVLINDAAQAIVNGGLKGGIPDDISALGLLATGDEKFLPMVRDYVRKRAKECEGLDVMGDKGIGTWHAGYQNILMTEYYLLTKDEQVIPGIKDLSEFLAYGQSGCGTWSHGISDVKLHGLYGPSAAYGAMNAASIPIVMSLVLAQKCGITTKPVNDAVNRSKSFYSYYVDKGAIPYGEHYPSDDVFDGNGKNSMAAVMFDLLGDKEATKYFSRMTLASSFNREGGHTGHFFAWQWGAPGTLRAGPAAAQAFAKNTRWFTEMERRADGSSVYQYQLKGDPSKYKGWETTGQRLMMHCFPRKVLYLTGKAGSCIDPLTDVEIKETLDAGTFNPTKLSVNELLDALGNWSPVVRSKAAKELGKRDDDLVEPLITMLDSPNRYARYGACTALRHCGRNSGKVVDALIHKIEHDTDSTMRSYAVGGLAINRVERGQKSYGMGSAVRKATPVLLKVSAMRDPADSLSMLSGQISDLLFYSGRVNDHVGYYPAGKGTEGIDRKLLIPAMKAWFANPNGGVRSNASDLLVQMNDKELEVLWADIYIMAKEPALANAMFAGKARDNGILAISRRHFEEGMPMAFDYLYQNGWGKFGRVPNAFEALSYYGSVVKPHIEEMRTREYEPYIKSRDPGQVKACKESWQKILDNSKNEVVLKSIKPYLDASDVKEREKVFPPAKN